MRRALVMAALGVALAACSAEQGANEPQPQPSKAPAEPTSTPRPEAAASPCKLASSDFTTMLGVKGKVGYAPADGEKVWYATTPPFPEGEPQGWSIWATGIDPGATPHGSGLVLPATDAARKVSEMGSDYRGGMSHRVGQAADDLTAALIGARTCVDLLGGQ